MSKPSLRSVAVIAASIVVSACGSAGPAQPSATAHATSAPTAVPVATSPAATRTAPSSATNTPLASPTPKPTRNPSAGYTDLKGWLVFEHFGQAPDGSTPTFDVGNRMIWMVHADGSGLHELSPKVPVPGKASPDISPDGKTVMFDSWDLPIQIWTAPIDGGAPTLISTDCDGMEDCIEGEPNYSGDGKKIAFTRQWIENGKTVSAIGMRDLVTGQVTLLNQTKTDPSVGYVTQPSLSPDATQVTYYRVAKTPTQDHPTGTTVVVAAVDGSSARDLPKPPGSDWASDPDWSHDGKSIVFATIPNREGEGWVFPGHDYGIWTVNPDGTNLINVCQGCLPSPVGPASGISPTWTSDDRILFWGYKTWALMNADGSDAAHINSPKLTWNGDGLGYNYAGFLQPTP